MLFHHTEKQSIHCEDHTAGIEDLSNHVILGYTKPHNTALTNRMRLQFVAGAVKSDADELGGI